MIGAVACLPDGTSTPNDGRLKYSSESGDSCGPYSDEKDLNYAGGGDASDLDGSRTLRFNTSGLQNVANVEFYANGAKVLVTPNGCVNETTAIFTDGVYTFVSAVVSYTDGKVNEIFYASVNADTPEGTTTTVPPTPGTFLATFDTASDFYDRFDFGVSGFSQLAAVEKHGLAHDGIAQFHGDHNQLCSPPTQLRDVSITKNPNGTHNFDQFFWHCAPGDDPAKGHMMTGIDTLGYQHSWFAPKGYFQPVSKVCWDVNETALSSRKWLELQFVGVEDAVRYPATTHSENAYAPPSYRGSGGFDLGYTDPGFRWDAPNNGLFPGGERTHLSSDIQPGPHNLAGLNISRGTYGWWQNGNQFTEQFAGWPGFDYDRTIADKAGRYTTCLEDNETGTLKITEESAGPDEIDSADNVTRIITVPGDIPDHPVRVVFHDSNYDPPKGDTYSPDKLTWHWDNIRIEQG